MAARSFAAATSQFSPEIDVDVPRLASAHQAYRVRLTALVNPPSGPIGLILKARIDGGPLLRLLVDSGAQYLVLDRKAGRKSGYANGAELDLVGAGALSRHAQFTTAGLLEVGEIAFRNCPMIIVEGKVLDGVDGVIPLSVFADFLVRLDVPGKVLELEPYLAESPSNDDAFFGVKIERHLLFLGTRLEEFHDSYLLLDTGSAYNVISTTAPPALRQARAPAQYVPLIAGAGKTGGRLLPFPVALRFGGRVLTLEPVVSVDLAELSRRHGIDISGVIGYPALAESVVTVNYRKALVRIQSK